MLTLLPMGVLQLEANIEHGYWFARSAEVTDRPIIDVLVWLRTPADIIFAVGALLVATMVASLWLAPGRPRETPVPKRRQATRPDCSRTVRGVDARPAYRTRRRPCRLQSYCDSASDSSDRACSRSTAGSMISASAP